MEAPPTSPCVCRCYCFGLLLRHRCHSIRVRRGRQFAPLTALQLANFDTFCFFFRSFHSSAGEFCFFFASRQNSWRKIFGDFILLLWAELCDRTKLAGVPRLCSRPYLATGLCRSDAGGNRQLKKLQPDIIGPVRHLRRAVSRNDCPWARACNSFKIFKNIFFFFLKKSMNKPSDHGNDRVCKGVCVWRRRGEGGGVAGFVTLLFVPNFLAFFSSSPLFLRCLLFFYLFHPPVCVWVCR